MYSKIQASNHGFRRQICQRKDYFISIENFNNWLNDVIEKVEPSPKIKYELFEKKAQLARYGFYTAFINYKQMVIFFLLFNA